MQCRFLTTILLYLQHLAAIFLNKYTNALTAFKNYIKIFSKFLTFCRIASITAAGHKWPLGYHDLIRKSLVPWMWEKDIFQPFFIFLPCFSLLYVLKNNLFPFGNNLGMKTGNPTQQCVYSHLPLNNSLVYAENSDYYKLVHHQSRCKSN